MKNDFARRAQNSSQPMIRIVDAYMRRDPSFLAFAEGNPALEACPKKAIAEIAEDLILNHDEDVLLYSNNGGDPEFKELVMQRLARVKGIDPAANDILIMTGGQQGLYLAPRLFVNPGDRVLMEEIAYAGMIDTIHDFCGETVGVKIDDDGINIDALEEALKTVERVKYLYLVPNFNNPTGVTLPFEKRKAVYELACKYDTMIVEDDPYGDLRYTGENVPTIKSLDRENRVVYLGTFSKTIAAGLRVGFMCASPEVITRATANKASIDSNTPCLNQLICRNYMRDYDFEGLDLSVRHEGKDPGEVHLGHLYRHRLLHHPRCCLGSCRYLQRTHHHPEPDRVGGPQQPGREDEEGLRRQGNAHLSCQQGQEVSGV